MLRETTSRGLCGLVCPSRTIVVFITADRIWLFELWCVCDRFLEGHRLGRLAAPESHDEGGFGVSNNTITRHAASYTTNARFVAFLGTFARPAPQVWLPGNYLQDPSSWVAPPLCTIKRLHGNLLQQYDCTEQSAVAQPAQRSSG